MKKLLFILLIFPFSLVYGQYTTPEVISSGGDSYSQPFGKMDVTIGEAVIETLNENNIFLTQGFQQSHFFAVSIQEDSESEDIGFNVYPNPATDVLNVFWNIDKTAIIYLYNLKGKLLMSESMYQNVQINISAYASGPYLLRLIEGNNQKVVIIQKLK